MIVMGKQEIIDFLKKNRGKKFDSKEIAKGTNVSSAFIPLKKLRGTSEINFEVISGNHNRQKFRYWID